MALHSKRMGPVCFSFRSGSFVFGRTIRANAKARRGVLVYFSLLFFRLFWWPGCGRRGASCM